MVVEALKGGLLALQDYVVYHILTCLIPAFPVSYTHLTLPTTPYV
jgi:hypothetical protein